MKSIMIVLVAVSMMLTGIASAEFIFDGTASTAWEEGANWIQNPPWSHGVVPGEFDVANIAYTKEAQLNSSQTVNALNVGSSWAGTGTATINSGGLHVKDQNNGQWYDAQVYVGSTAGTTCELNINGGANVFDRVLVLGNTSGATGTLNMYGGTLDVGVDNPRGIWDGGITASAGNAYINIYGGILTTPVLKDWNAGSGDFQIYFGSTDGKMIITEEYLTQSGQYIGNMLAAGDITAAPGLEIVMQTFESAPGVFDAEIFAVAVPEPAALGLLVMGGGLLVIRRKFSI